MEVVLYVVDLSVFVTPFLVIQKRKGHLRTSVASSMHSMYQFVRLEEFAIKVVLFQHVVCFFR